MKANKDKVGKSSYISLYANSVKREKSVRIEALKSSETREKAREFIDETLRNKFKEVKLPNGDTARRLYLKNDGREYVVGRNFFSETMAKNIRNKRLKETLEVAANVNEWFPTATFDRIEEGKHHDFSFKVFRATYHGKRIECKVKLTSEQILYTMRLL